MLKLYYIFYFAALFSLIHSRPFCPYYSGCYNDFQNYGYSFGCGWGSPSIPQPKYVLVCPASRTAINCGMLPEAQSCTTDDGCGYGQKCCEDGCFTERVCKPGFYVEAKPRAATTTEISVGTVELE